MSRSLDLVEKLAKASREVVKVAGSGVANSKGGKILKEAIDSLQKILQEVDTLPKRTDTPSKGMDHNCTGIGCMWTGCENNPANRPGNATEVYD